MDTFEFVMKSLETGVTFSGELYNVDENFSREEVKKIVLLMLDVFFVDIDEARQT